MNESGGKNRQSRADVTGESKPVAPDDPAPEGGAVTGKSQSEVARKGPVRRWRMILALVGHELRSPLGTIVSGIKLLARHPLSDESKKVVAMMERQASHASRLISDLLDLSRVSSGTFRITLERTTAQEILQLVMESCAPLAQERSRNLESQLEDGLAPFLGDRDRLVQALRNLVENAIKFTQTNGLISLRATASEAGIQFSVCDDGIGISPEDLPRLGLPFSQLETARARRADGLGLGLHIVKTIAEAHGGSLAVTSDGPAKGSCISFEVPCRESSDG